jgi:serine kinase of HPr protein (carbohydrate metabolism regulator)
VSTIHASAVLVGARAALLRGQSGAGKSRLALRLIEAGNTGQLPFVRLVADDRTAIRASHGRLLVQAPDSLAGLLEIRGRGIFRMPYEAIAVAGWVVDLSAESERLPTERADTHIAGVNLPRFAFPPCADPLPVLLAAFRAYGGKLAEKD